MTVISANELTLILILCLPVSVRVISFLLIDNLPALTPGSSATPHGSSTSATSRMSNICKPMQVRLVIYTLDTRYDH
jgi:hypothetical protein